MIDLPPLILKRGEEPVKLELGMIRPGPRRYPGDEYFQYYTGPGRGWVELAPTGAYVEPTNLPEALQSGLVNQDWKHHDPKIDEITDVSFPNLDRK